MMESLMTVGLLIVVIIEVRIRDPRGDSFISIGI
jgi:hypothetical protein